MKDIQASPIRGIQNGTKIRIIDNSGAKIARVITIKNYGGTHRRLQKGAVGSLCTVSVIAGDLSLRKGVGGKKKGVQYAIIVQQRGIIRRRNGAHVQFEQNAGVLCSKEGDLKGSMIRGAVAQEAVARWPTIGMKAQRIR
jgi:large subunit ribosomal protein L14